MIVTIVTRDANATYSAHPIGEVPPRLKGMTATCTAGRRQAIQALIDKAQPPLKFVRITFQCEVLGPNGESTGRIENDVEIEES